MGVRVVKVLLATCLAGCLEFPPAKPCTTNGDCPTTERCQAASGRCEVRGLANDAGAGGVRAQDAVAPDARVSDDLRRGEDGPQQADGAPPIEDAAAADGARPMDSAPLADATRAADALLDVRDILPPAPDAGPMPPRWRSVSAGYHHTCAIDDLGRLSCWGDGRQGQLGSVVPGDRSGTPVAVETGTPGLWLAVSCGLMHTCALFRPDARGGDQLWCWGRDSDGQLGDGPVGDLPPNEMTAHPVRVAGPGWTQVSAGGSHTCGFRDGHLYCWGSNEHGQLGLPCPDAGGPPGATTPQLVDGDWSLVATSRNTHYHQHLPNRVDFTCATAQADDRVFCWGADQAGQLGGGAPITCQPAPLAVGDGRPFQALGAGSRHACGLSNGEVWCWGQNSQWNMLGNAGGDGYGLAAAVEDSGGWEGLAVGSDHSCVWTPSRTRCWGMPLNGELGSGSFIGNWFELTPLDGADWEALSVGSGHTCGLTGSGLSCWGDRGDGQIGDGQISDRFVPTEVRLDEAAQPADAGVPPADAGDPCPIPSSGWTALATAPTIACGLHDGGLYCWGQNDQGQLPGIAPAAVVPSPVASAFSGPWTGLAAGGSPANGTTTLCAIDDACGASCWSYPADPVVTDVPAFPEDGAGWTALAIGEGHVCGLRAPCGGDPHAAGGLWCWGHDELGQLGDGQGVVQPVPIVPDPPGAWLRVAAAGRHTCAIDERHALWCWGEGAPLGRVGADDDWTELAAAPGATVLCAVRHAPGQADGRLFCWDPWSSMPGVAYSPPPDVPTLDNARAVSVATRDAHLCAVTSECGLKCLGYNHFGQLGDGSSDLRTNDWREADRAATPAGGGTWATVIANADDSQIRAFTCAIRLDGTLWCWGFDGKGGLGIGLGPAMAPEAVDPSPGR